MDVCANTSPASLSGHSFCFRHVEIQVIVLTLICAPSASTLVQRRLGLGLG